MGTDHDTTDRNTLIAEVLPDYRGWLYRVAMDLLPADAWQALLDDVAQEGYIAMWRAAGTWDPGRGALPSWLTGAARLRMRDVTRGHGQWTGHEPVRGVTGGPDPEPLDVVQDDWLPAALVDSGVALEAVEDGYHHGVIAQAVAALPPEQRRYVFLRFWVGLDPASRAPEMRALRALFPEMGERGLWDGRTGARRRLAEALAPLVQAAG